jgi:hypothetical protein
VDRTVCEPTDPDQAAAPEGPVDMIMMYVLHHAFRCDLAAFAADGARRRSLGVGVRCHGQPGQAGATH